MPYDDEKTVPCATCGASTTKTSTKRCDWCWEVEQRLDGYLQRGGAQAQKVLIAALVRHPVEVPNSNLDRYFDLLEAPENAGLIAQLFARHGKP